MKNLVSVKSVTFLMIMVCLLITTVINKQLYSQIPTPTCVCAECNKKCGTGHEKTCSSYSKKTSDAVKDMSEKSLSDAASMNNFAVAVDSGLFITVTNKNNFAVKYSFEYDIKNKDEVITYTGTDYSVKPNTEAMKLFTVVNDAVITRVLLTKAEKIE